MTGPLSLPDRAVVEAHLRRLDPPELAAFVADLWGARGYETTHSGTVVTAKRRDETLMISVIGAVPADATADAVVVAGKTTGADGTLDAADLTEQLWYAVERPVARKLCVHHIGHSPAELPASVWLRVRTLVPATLASVAIAALLVGVVVAVAVGATIGLGLLPDDGDTGATPTGTDSGQSPQTPAKSNTADPIEPPPADTEQYPPGLSADGITDLEALSSAHSAVTGNRSYRLRLDRFRPEIWGNSVVDVQRTTEATVSDDRYLLDATQTVNDETIPLGTWYHNGTETYIAQRGFSGVAYRRVESLAVRDSYPPAPTALAGRLVTTRLSTPTTNVTGTLGRDGERLFVLEGTGQPAWPDIGEVRKYNVSALITERGLVRELTISYTGRDGDRLVGVQREVVYRGIGESPLEPPIWYRQEFADDG